MAAPRDAVYVANRQVNLTAIMAGNDQIALEEFSTALVEMMNEVKTQMEKAGHGPNQMDLPVLTMTFQAKGGPHHVRQDQQGD